MYLITKEFRFEAAHRLTKVPEGHKCRRMHGHQYVVTIELAADELDEHDFVVDFGDLNTFGTHLNDRYDHRVLNDVLEIETTAENLARELYRYAARQWPQTTRVTVAETLGTTATYRP